MFSEDLPNEGYLTIGTLLNKYCRQHGCNNGEINSILDRFVNKLRNCEANDRTQEDRVVAILKGLRNTQNIDSKSINAVVQCIGKDVSRIKSYSIQALSATNGDKVAEQTLLSLLKNRELDSEFRIEAYLSLVVTPTPSLAEEIKTLLSDEPVYQVGSFITSHIASLRASVDPSKYQAKQILGGIQFSNKFPKDFRRYSFSQEFSYAVDSLGVGGSVETNVIYSQRNFLPRSGALNFTSELFGTSFNVFELSGRQENLERIIEYYLGPKGYLNTHTEQEIYDEFVNSIDNANKNNNQPQPSSPRSGRGKQRHRRGLREDAEAFGKNVNLGYDADSDIDFDVSLKLFGSEIFFLSLGQHAITTPNDIDKQFREVFLKTLNTLSSTEKTIDYHTLFLDAELAYPTSIGFPVKLVTHGSGVLHFEIKSAIDIPAIISNLAQSEINIKIVPSVNLLVSGVLTFDASYVTSGIQVSGSLHSSTGIDVSLKVINDGQGVNADIRFPTTKQEIISLDHSISFIQQNKGQPIVKESLKFNSKR